MIKIILLITFYLISSFGDESNTLQKQNVLYVQNLIDKEEKIAQNFEKYILTEFEIPTLVKLQKDEYLGSNFSFENIMGDPLSLDTSGTKIKLKYAVSKKISTEQNYIVQLYNRELYREYTKVEFDTVNIEKSHIWFDLKSKEANTIYSILKGGESIEKTCSAGLKNKYCNNNLKSIRYYDANSDWIEYSKKDFINGNITVSNERLISSDLNGDNAKNFKDVVTKVRKLKVGAYIFVKENSEKKYIKFEVEPGGTNTGFKILRVN
ncbi:MAG: hypothetical protein RBS32_01325 [Aliarcobacter sp.]|jgi:hypothetical protein|nr:hypothetical protein [Aliarcobacter sp.]